MGGINAHASKQLEELMLEPILALHLTTHPRGKGGKEGAGRGPAEMLSVDMYVSFHSGDGSFDGGEGSDMLSTLDGKAMVPSHSGGIVLGQADRREALAAA